MLLPAASERFAGPILVLVSKFAANLLSHE
jgi:hypothetical protein